MNRNISFELKKAYILEIVQNGGVEDLINFLGENNFSLVQISNDNFDLLIYAIENFTSLDVIYYIIKQGGYETLNYTFYDYSTSQIISKNGLSHEPLYGVFKVPLFSSIACHNFEVADMLIRNKADINYIIDNFYVLKSGFTKEYYYGDIIEYLNLLNALTVDNLKFILNRGFNISIINSGLITELISYEYEDKTKLLEVIFKHFIYDNKFIIQFLLFYKNHQSLTKTQLQKLITIEKNKIKISDSFYKNAYSKENNNIIKIFLDYDGSEPNVLFNRIDRYGNLLKVS